MKQALSTITLLTILVLAPFVQAMEHYTNSATDQTGKVIGGAQVAVYKTGTTTLATIYSDNGITTKSNPFLTNTLSGVVEFYAENGAYDLVLTAPGRTFNPSDTQRIIIFDPHDMAGTVFPSSPFLGQMFIVLDDSTNGACDSNVGNFTTLCTWDGSIWTGIGNGVSSGWPSISTIKTVNWANSLANALRIGDGTTPTCFYTDPTLGPLIRPCTAANTRTYVLPNFNWSLYDEEGTADILTVDPDAASKNAMYQFGANYRPLKSAWIGAGALDGDGTQCPALATSVTINSGPKLPTFICTDNDSATLYGSLKMPGDYDGGTITFTQSIIQTAADTSAINGDIAAQCRGNSETPSSTWGTEVALDLANVSGSNDNDFITSAAVTPAGTCAAGDMLYFRYQLDAAGTTTAVATLHHVGFMLTYSSNSLSH